MAIDTHVLSGPYILTVGIASLAYIVIWLLRCNRRPKTFPPGPTTLPLLGNIHQIPLKHSFLKFTEWSKQYGDIIGLKIGPQNMVILNSPELIREFFVTRGTIYSGRPILYILKHHVFPGQDHNIFMQNDSTLREWRTAVKRLTGSAGLKEILPMQNAIASKLITNLLDNKQTPARSLEIWSLTTAMAGVWGQAGIEHAPRIINYYVQVQHELLELADPAKAPPLDLIPILRYLPLSNWKKKAQNVGKSLDMINSTLLGDVKLGSSQATEDDNKQNLGLIGGILQDQQTVKRGSDKATRDFSESQLKSMAQVLVDAGTDTTASTAMSCILALATHPNVLKRLRDEIDAVCGREKQPETDYIDKLPYLKACVLETLRWRSPGPTLLPHCNEREDTFQGFHFPKNTIFMANVYAVFHDPKYFEDPETFKPERFLDGSAEKGVSPFGIGRRMCPGDQFAMASLRLAVSKVVWAFDLVVDNAELDLSIETGYISGIILTPKEFPIKFVPRTDRLKMVAQIEK